MGNNLDAPARSSDAFVPEAAPSQERPLVSHPNNPTDAADFQSSYAAALASGKDTRLTDPMLKGFEITGDLSGGSTDTASTDSTSSTTSEISNDSDGDGIPDSTDTVEVTCSEMQSETEEQKDTDYDGIPDDPNLPSSTQLKDLIASVEHGNEVIPDDPDLPAGAVLEQIAELQEDHERGEDSADLTDIASNANAIEFSHAGEDSYDDTGTIEARPTPQSGTHHFRIDQIAEKRKRQAEAESGELQVGLSGAGSDELAALNALKLEARAFAGESTIPLGSLPQGLDKISIADITTRKEEDGSVVLVAPRGGDAGADKVAIVDKDGFNIKAATLPGFLRPDGTIVMDEDGRAYRPGDNFVAATPTDQSTAFDKDPNAVERSPMLDKTELTNLAGKYVNEQIATSEKFAALRDTKSDARYEKSVASNSGDSSTNNTAEMSFDPNDSAEQPKEAAEQQRSIKVRLGETVRSLALRELNDAKNWVALAEKNNLSTETDDRGAPIASLQRGMILNLPTASELENFQARASLAASLQLT